MRSARCRETLSMRSARSTVSRISCFSCGLISMYEVARSASTEGEVVPGLLLVGIGELELVKNGKVVCREVDFRAECDLSAVQQDGTFAGADSQIS